MTRLEVHRQGSTVTVIGTDQIIDARNEIPWAKRWVSSHVVMVAPLLDGGLRTVNVYEVVRGARPAVRFYGVEA